MKNLFCQTIDFFTGRVIDEEINAKKESTASSELLSRASKIDDEIYKLNKRRTTLCMIAFFAHLLIFLIVNTVLFAYSIEKKGDNIAITIYLILFLIELISGISFLVYFWKCYRKKEAIQLKKELYDVKAQIFESLNVPKEAKKIDFLFNLKNQKGRKAKYYGNRELLAYRKGHNLCFASRISVYSIPIFSIKKTYINDKMEYYDGWNKEDFEEDEVYKDSIYIERNRYGQALRKFMENSYHIEIELNGEMYEIIVPNYDFRELEEIYREI